MSRSATLTSDAASVSTARQFVTDVLNELACPDAAWSAVLIVSELTTNVLLHAPSATMTVTVTVADNGGRRVRLEVSDNSPAIPRMRSYDDLATTGRGLRLVQDLSTAWGVEPAASGKYIWVELAEPAALQLDEAAAVQSGAAGFEKAVDVDALLAMFDDDPSGQAVEPRACSGAVLSAAAPVVASW